MFTSCSIGKQDKEPTLADLIPDENIMDLHIYEIEKSKEKIEMSSCETIEGVAMYYTSSNVTDDFPFRGEFMDLPGDFVMVMIARVNDTNICMEQFIKPIQWDNKLSPKSDLNLLGTNIKNYRCIGCIDKKLDLYAFIWSRGDFLFYLMTNSDFHAQEVAKNIISKYNSLSGME